MKVLVRAISYTVLAMLIFLMVKYGEVPGGLCIIALILFTGAIAWLLNRQLETDKKNK